MSKQLTAEQRGALRGRAHTLHPVVLIGDKGLTDAVVHEIDVHLRAHELIKIRAQGDRDAREAWLRDICERLLAQPVQHVGKTLVIYRERPPEPRAQPVRPPKRPARTPAQSKRAADRARARLSAERAPAARPARRRARIR
jgi:RNA-binding protein